MQQSKKKVLLTRIAAVTAITCCCLGFVCVAFAILVRPAICSAISSAFSEVAKETPVGDLGQTNRLRLYVSEIQPSSISGKEYLGCQDSSLTHHYCGYGLFGIRHLT